MTLDELIDTLTEIREQRLRGSGHVPDVARVVIAIHLAEHASAQEWTIDEVTFDRTGNIVRLVSYEA